MGFGFLSELFKSREERETERRVGELRAEKEKKAKIRKAKFEVEKFVSVSKDKIRFLEEENEKLRAKAREYLKAGKKSLAQNEVEDLRANDAEIAKWRTTAQVFSAYLSKIERGQIIADIREPIEALADAVSINPESILGMFDKLDDKTGETADLDRIFSSVLKEQRRVSHYDTTIPDVDEYMKDLEREVVSEISGGASTATSSVRTNPNQDVESARDKLNDVLNGKRD